MSQFRFRTAAVALAGVLALPSAAAHATQTRIVLQTWNPKTPTQNGLKTVYDQPNGLENALRTAWSLGEGAACDKVDTMMSGMTQIGTIERPTCDLGQLTGITVAAANGKTITLNLVATKNNLAFKAVRDNGPDLLVAITTDLDITLKAHVGDGNSLLVIDSATVKFANVQPDVNAATGLGEAAIDALKIAGVDFRKWVSDHVEQQNVTLGGDAFSSVNAQFQSATGPLAGAIGVGIWKKGDLLVLGFMPNLNIPHNGVITGHLTSQNASIPCAGFALQAYAQVGPAKLSDPTANPPRFDTASAPTVTTATAMSSGSSGQCTYQLTGAGAGVPNTVMATAPKSGGPVGNRPRPVPPQQVVTASASNVNFQVIMALGGDANYYSEVNRLAPGQMRPGEAQTHQTQVQQTMGQAQRGQVSRGMTQRPVAASSHLVGAGMQSQSQREVAAPAMRATVTTRAVKATARTAAKARVVTKQRAEVVH